MSDGPDFSLADVAREGLIERPGAEPATHDGSGRVDLSFTVHTLAEGGAEVPATQRGVRVPEQAAVPVDEHGHALGATVVPAPRCRTARGARPIRHTRSEFRRDAGRAYRQGQARGRGVGSRKRPSRQRQAQLKQ